MFNVYFWTLTKKNNSTLQPTTGRTDFSCIIKDGSGILNPSIQLDLGLVADPSAFNYAQIPEFNRYYFVTEWYFENGLWTADLKVDVLATYKSNIGAASLYVLRASAASDGNIIDNMYPCKSSCAFEHTTMASPYLSSGGTYVLGCVSVNGDYGSLTYYAVQKSELTKICTYLISSAVSVGNGFSVNDASMALQTSLIDPLQYIKTCMYFPFALTDFDLQTATTSINIFKWNISNVFNARISGDRIAKSYNLTIKKHPATNSRGNYVNCAPYSKLSLFANPFGVIELDTTVTCNAANLYLELTIDPITGRGSMRILANNTVLHVLQGQIGVPIQLSQVTRDILGAASSAMGGIAGAVGGALTGNIGGAISSAVSGIGNAAASLIPRQQSIGTGGGFSDIAPFTWTLDHQFFNPVNDDNTHNGRPYCQMTTPANLGGYMLIQDGDVAIPGTSDEADEVRALLESGFYYE